MDTLVADGLVVLGGPVGEGDGAHVPLVLAASEAELRARLAEDPWAGDLLTITSVEPWQV